MEVWWCDWGFCEDVLIGLIDVGKFDVVDFDVVDDLVVGWGWWIDVDLENVGWGDVFN